MEQLILAAAPNLLKTGNVAVRNQHASLRRAYDYFCVRAQNPSHIEDETVVHKSTGSVTATSFTSGRIQMQLNAFHDMIAAISAYISLLEHDLVLSIPFTELDPNQYDLIDVIGLRWRDKWNLILDNKPDSQHFRQRLYDVVERWRNPYSHGGFEKGHDATLWLHAPPIGIFPVGLTRIRDSPLFSLMPAGETNIADVFTFFGEVDTWFSDQLPEATRLIASGLDVRYDADFRLALSEAHATGSFNDFLQYREYRQDMVDNMDC